nr:agmatine deiminase family protein [Hyphomonas sp. Mor2]
MSQDCIYVPPEWAPQAAVWVGWPHIRGEWGEAFNGARAEIADFVRALSKGTPVRIACGSREAYTSAWLALEGLIETGRVQLHTVLSGDIWLRDTGPVLARQGRSRTALRFQFNGWGGKYVMPGDTETAQAIASVDRVSVETFPFVLEGGAVDLDGAGRLLTTRQCVLNPNRNPGWTEMQAEQALKHAFGVEQVIWLDQGLSNDHTDGHVDNIARFVGPGRVICQAPSGADDPNAQTLGQVEDTLREAGLHVVTIPSPGLITDAGGAPVPASHANFLISNKMIFLPVYEDTYSPLAGEALAQAMPGFEVVALPARHILSGGGAFHCMTQQVPEFEEITP